MKGISARDLYGGSDVVRSKYGVAKKSDRTMDGIVFDSKAECKRYAELRLLERAGQISDLELQPEYMLIYPFTHGGKKYRGVKYRADFKYFEIDRTISDFGTWVVEDVKGVLTQAYAMKKKLLLSKYPDICFREVKA